MAKRKIKIPYRQVTVGSSSTFNPDKHGDDRAPARDMRLEILLEKHETAQFFGMAKAALDHVFWDDKGDPLLEHVKEFTTGTRIKVDGTAEIGIVGGNYKMQQLEDCMISRFKFAPQMGYRCLLTLNLHFDPTGIAEQCDAMVVKETCRFEFEGMTRKEDDDGAGKNEGQGSLPV